MTKIRAAIRFLYAVSVFALRGLQRIVKLLARPGVGPFLAGA